MLAGPDATSTPADGQAAPIGPDPRQGEGRNSCPRAPLGYSRKRRAKGPTKCTTAPSWRPTTRELEVLAESSSPAHRDARSQRSAGPSGRHRAPSPRRRRRQNLAARRGRPEPLPPRSAGSTRQDVPAKHRLARSESLVGLGAHAPGAPRAHGRAARSAAHEPRVVRGRGARLAPLRSDRARRHSAGRARVHVPDATGVHRRRHRPGAGADRAGGRGGEKRRAATRKPSSGSRRSRRSSASYRRPCPSPRSRRRSTRWCGRCAPCSAPTPPSAPSSTRRRIACGR